MAINQEKLQKITRRLADIAEQTSRLQERVRSEGVTQGGRVLLPPERQGVRDVRLEGGQPLDIGRETARTAETAGIVAGQTASSYQAFSQKIMEMLQQAQQGIVPQVVGLEQQALGLEEERARTGMQTPQELIGAAPSLQAGVRGAEMEAFAPGIERARQAGKTLSSRLQQFESILKYAKEFGEDFAKISPTPEIVEGYKQMIQAGGSPSSIPDEVRNQVIGKMTTDNWNAWAEANRKGQQVAAEGLTQYQTLNSLNQIRTGARQDPDIKIFSDVRGAYEQGRGGALRKNGLGDIILMRTLAKITDPSSSVREEEFATFEDAQSTLARYGIRLTKKMWAGDRLTDGARTEFLSQLQDIYNQRKGAYDNAWNFYDSQAQELNLPTGQVLPKYYAPESEQQQNIINKGGRTFEILP